MEPLYRVPILLLRCFLQLSQKHLEQRNSEKFYLRQIYLEFPELPDNGLVQEEPDVLLVVQGLHLAHVPLLSPLSVPWLSGENSFQDAETTEILNKYV